MIKIEKNDIAVGCDNCKNEENTNFIDTEYSAMVLCDKCLQELNRKIVEHLADKNI